MVVIGVFLFLAGVFFGLTMVALLVVASEDSRRRENDDDD